LEVKKVDNTLSKSDKRKYAIYRNVNFVLLILGYVGYYFVKYSYKKVYGSAYVMTGLEYGAIGLSFNMVYGMSKFLSGNIADRTNAK
jgi:OPA family glycerol-3-phosphate transporter-like MFS transporter